MTKNELIQKQNWNKFELRKADEEEKIAFGDDEVWKLPVPDSEEKVLVSDGIDIWTDEWYRDTYGANLVDTDALGLYWMSLPELPKEALHET